MAKIKNDKYYTPDNLAKYVVEKTKEIAGEQNITQYLEPSAGAGVFLNHLPNGTLAYDIEPENSRILKQDFLTLELDHKNGRCIIGNPPYGRCLSMANKFFKKSILLGDYIAFILPISQYKNINFLYEFDLIYSEDLKKHMYTDRELHCCLNIYSRPAILNKKPKHKLNDISIIRQDSKKYDAITDFDVRFCYWGDGTAGKILKNGEKYSAEYKIIINNDTLRNDIIDVLVNFNWKDYRDRIAMRKIQQHHIISVLKDQVPNIK